MTDREKIIDGMVEENRRRYALLTSRYDPMTGAGAPGEREMLALSDFPIPVQWVPRKMMDWELTGEDSEWGRVTVRDIARVGSVKEFVVRRLKGTRVMREALTMEILRARHKFDFVFWAYDEIHILGKEGGVLNFVLNKAQLKLLEILEDLREKGPIEVIICKARQWGASTLLLFYQWWLALEWDPTYTFSVLAQNVGVADDIATRMDFAFQNYDAWDLYLPIGTRLHLQMKQKGNEYSVRDGSGNAVRQNRVRIGSIGSPDNLRGLPGFGAHFSEMGVWPDSPGRRPMDLIKAVTAAIPRRRNTLIAIESTAKGSGNAFHEEYLRAKRGESNFRAVFVAWWEIEYDVLPVKDEWEFAAWLYDNREKSEAGAPWLDSGKYYWYQWELGATFQGISWYRTERKSYSHFSDMASENPTDDIEAFQNSGKMVFDMYHIERLRQNCRAPRWRGELTSMATVGQRVLKDIRFNETQAGKLRIWEMPDRSMKISNRYLVVVDVGGRSETSDWSVVRVFDRFPMMTLGRMRVVATMRYHVDPDILAYDAMRLARWYCDALLVIESNTLETHDRNRQVDGGQSQYVLDIVGAIYPNLYARRTTPDTIGDDVVNKWGFHTNVSTKPAIIGHLITCVRESAWVERDEQMCDELAIYEERDNKFNAMVGAGNHDDVLMATAIALWVGMNEMETPHEVKKESVQGTLGRSSGNSAAVI